MRPLVIYIIGDVRSGSTLLDSLLSNHPDAVSVGELSRLSEFYFEKTLLAKSWDYKCGCGEVLNICSFWKEIIQNSDLPEHFETRISVNLPKLHILNSKRFTKSLKKIIMRDDLLIKAKNISKNYWSIYNSIYKHTGKKIIIDSSKNALQAFYLNRFKEGDIHFILLERDIKAVAYSKLNRLNEKSSYVRSRANNIFFNLATSFLTLIRNRQIGKIIHENETNKIIIQRINYDRLTNCPEATINEIYKWVGLTSFSLPKLTRQNSSVQHMIGGSPGRSEGKDIKPDRRSKQYYKDKIIASWFGKLLEKKINHGELF